MTTATYVTVYAGPSTSCYSCGVTFWMEGEYYNGRLADHRTFYCPNGHGQQFTGETEAARFKRLFKSAEDRANRARHEADQAEASRRAWKGQATRLRRRVIAGHCPFCDTDVAQLAWHIEHKHRDIQSNDEAEPVETS